MAGSNDLTPAILFRKDVLTATILTPVEVERSGTFS